jgi:HD-GYP domain-containing protein (c-di-GMP phosphodiesterase class II)
MRRQRRLNGRAEQVALALAAGFIFAALAAAMLLPAGRPFSPLAALISLLTYAVVSRVWFEVNNGAVLPTQLVLVPMLFVLPPRIVPLVVAAAIVIGQAPKFAQKRFTLSHIPVHIFNATHALGPAVVLALAGAPSASWRQAPLYLLALAAQFTADLVPGTIYSRVAWRVPVAQHVRSMRVAFFVDAALAPIALAVAIASGGHAWTMLVVLPLVALLKFFARERQVRIDHTLELSTAYRGTAMLLGDVIEADDEYTGTHSRDVVELVVAVADRLGLDPRQRQRAEFAAMLHDVGKVKIPPEIINKPGPLDEAERAVINTHTIIGQEMLEQVGGLLGDVGDIVRSCHERWDGAGYPDRLSGEAIPLEARIVCACDAWSAMTTDRAYRKALPDGLALAELHTCSGSQFDPRVVEALVAVLAR